MNLNQVTMPATDVSASVRFYQQLGLTLIVDSVPRYARLELPGGNSTLSVERVEQVPSGPGVVVYFECEDLDEQVESLKAQRLEFEHDLVDQSWLWREARLRDPAGNLICLYHAGGNRKNPPWRVK
jgi:catechol 2,3-dioxygenase-like lactoylglutathione lyase family enzyme